MVALEAMVDRAGLDNVLYALASICAASAHLQNDTRGGWHIAGADINWEDPDLYCDHTGERIESAYAED